MSKDKQASRMHCHQRQHFHKKHENRQRTLGSQGPGEKLAGSELSSLLQKVINFDCSFA